MNTLLSTISLSTRVAVLGLAMLAVLAVPLFASAATFAYVDQAGAVRMVVADAPLVAIATAPNIHVHSGVIQLMTQTDYNIVGGQVNGI